MTLWPTSIPASLSHENQSNTVDGVCRYDRNSLMFTVVPVYIGIISALGIILNVFVLMVFCLHKKACTVAEIYLSNLAAADLFLVSMLPFWAVNVAKRYTWPFGESLCKLVPFSITMNAYCSIYTLVLVSIDRYLALVHPLTTESVRRPLYAKLACVVVWGVCVLLNVPVLIYRKIRESDTACFNAYPTETKKETETAINITNVILSFIIPILIIFFCTLKIIHALRNRLRDSLNTEGKEQKATTLILIVLLAFLICWVPYHVIKILDLLSRHNILTRCDMYLNLTQQIFFYFAFFNSVLNPILYVCVGRNFRKKVKEVFSQMSNKRKSTFSLVSTRTNLSRSVGTQEATKSSAYL
ncbi:B2 bradykinin receptor-like [Stegastes partitus]|uniref:B2 bradykinin receptor-like n=1 Tax=Stegastes partitus TaxID=144197 RepID=A0A9Y4U364_9TELE|nr:PREDICTED: B2 bradykinin receptor-like [Stegastes partitus]